MYDIIFNKLHQRKKKLLKENAENQQARNTSQLSQFQSFHQFVSGRYSDQLMQLTFMQF